MLALSIPQAMLLARAQGNVALPFIHSRFTRVRPKLGAVGEKRDFAFCCFAPFVVRTPSHKETKHLWVIYPSAGRSEGS